KGDGAPARAGGVNLHDGRPDGVALDEHVGAVHPLAGGEKARGGVEPGAAPDVCLVVSPAVGCLGTRVPSLGVRAVRLVVGKYPEAVDAVDDAEAGIDGDVVRPLDVERILVFRPPLG